MKKTSRKTKSRKNNIGHSPDLEVSEEVKDLTPEEASELRKYDRGDFVASLLLQTMKNAPDARTLMCLSAEGTPGLHWAKDLMVLMQLERKLKSRHTIDAELGLMLMSAIGKVVMPLLRVRESQRVKGARRTDEERIARQINMAQMVKEALVRSGGKRKMEIYAEVASHLGVPEAAVREAWGTKDRGRR